MPHMLSIERIFTACSLLNVCILGVTLNRRWGCLIKTMNWEEKFRTDHYQAWTLENRCLPVL